jgi:hypothetical protein
MAKPSRTLNVTKSSRDLLMRIAPERIQSRSSTQCRQHRQDERIYSAPHSRLARRVESGRHIAQPKARHGRHFVCSVTAPAA